MIFLFKKWIGFKIRHMKILSVDQIRKLDAHTIAQQSIDSIDLMERACRAFVDRFTEIADVDCKIGVVCGTGNNGGDGFGIARILLDRGYEIEVWALPGNPTADYTINLDRAKQNKVPVCIIVDESSFDDSVFNGCDILIDAIFGSGLSRPPEGIHARVIELMNRADAKRIAVDIPSGLSADRPSDGSIVRADVTITFQVPKLSFFLPSYFQYTGDWLVVDIGLSKDFVREAETSYHYLTGKGLRKRLKRRSKFDHKGVNGHALLIAGSLGKMGAAVLASRAALRSGLGLLTTHVPRQGVTIIQTSVPEAMASIDRNDDIFTSPPDVGSYAAIGVGPGIGTAIETTHALRLVLEHFRNPMVIDADALNIIAENRELLALIPEGSILTPHPKEFERLVGKWKDDFERLELQRKLAEKIRCVVIVKGAFTAIAVADGRIFFNSTGNPGMATGGTGDVLTGILTGLLAQQYEPATCAMLGVYLHGLAADVAVPEIGLTSLIAGDIVKFLPSAFLRLRRD
jgi:hydroxyethylthiazole kinase-like uncharacterized protein yjeF